MRGLLRYGSDKRHEEGGETERLAEENRNKKRETVWLIVMDTASDAVSG